MSARHRDDTEQGNLIKAKHSNDHQKQHQQLTLIRNNKSMMHIKPMTNTTTTNTTTAKRRRTTSIETNQMSESMLKPTGGGGGCLALHRLACDMSAPSRRRPLTNSNHSKRPEQKVAGSNSHKLTSVLGAACACLLVLLVALVAGHQTVSASDTSSLNQTSAASSSSAAADLSAAASELAGDFAVAASTNNNNYNNDHQQQQQQSHGNKAKKIQIVYIKVPLAKLRPSLGHANSDNQNTYGQQAANYSAPSKADQQYEQSIEATSNRSSSNSYSGQQAAGSQQQPFDEQQVQLAGLGDFSAGDGSQQTEDADSLGSSPRGQQQRPPSTQQQSFLIPLALVQSDAYNQDEQRQQPDAQHLSFGAQRAQGPSLQVAPSEQHLAGRRSPGQIQQQLRLAANSLNQPSISHSLNTGFMSSFLSAEKEKMTAAALRLQQAASQVTSAVANYSSQPLTTSTSLAPPMGPSNNPKPPAGQLYQHQHQHHGPGGLMPVMMMPLSRMPDSAIGQAYGAAVGNALPIESGSPVSSLLSSSSSNLASSSTGYKQQAAAAQGNSNNNHTKTGGAAGTHSDANYSPGTGSNGSYGTSGHGPSAGGTPANGYQGSGSSFGGTAPTSGYGSGTNTFGASVAFSDYPAAPSAGSNSNSYSHLSSGDVSANGYGQDNSQRLKQAKKTIIPIVVQVEHAILENANAAQAAAANAYQKQQQQQQVRGNKYGRSNRQLGNGKRGSRYNNAKDNSYRQQGNQLFSAATQDVANYGEMMGSNAQFINAANAHDINQITAAINAENAASAAAALAQADAAFGPSSPAYTGAAAHMHQQMRPQQHQQQHQSRPQSAYAAGLQSAASALLAQTHPVFQAAASGGLAQVSKLGAKLGEMMALPSMQVPNSISSIGAALPSAFSGLTGQLGQAVQQVAKEHPTAHAFARQVAQQAGIQLPSFVGGQSPSQQIGQMHPAPQQSASSQASSVASMLGQQLAAAASSPQMSQMSTQAQLQNLKLGIGQSLQSAAAQLMGVHQKANAQQASSLLSSPNQMAWNAALKQLSAISPAAAQLAGQLAGIQPQQGQQQASSPFGDSQMASSSSLVPVQQQLNAFLQQAQGGASSGDISTAGSSTVESSKPAGKGIKSKFLSFFQPPKFISNLLSWNDRADERQDQGSLTDLAGNSTTKAVSDNKNSNSTASSAPASTVSLSSTTASLPSSSASTSKATTQQMPSSSTANTTTTSTTTTTTTGTSTSTTATPSSSSKSS